MALNVVKSLATWTFQDSHVERNLDSAAYEAAHPDDTLVLAGPPRHNQLTGNTPYETMLPIGMVQQISFQQGKPTQPLMAVGSGRSFFTSGKAQTSWSAARLFMTGKNLLRILHNNSVTGTTAINAQTLDDQAAVAEQGDYFINLDSELYYIPFGMMCLFKNKAHDFLGAFYVEMCMIASWAASINAGQSQIMESVSGLADRILPVSVLTAAPTYANRKAMDAIIGFSDGGAAADGGLSGDLLDGRIPNVTPAP